MPTGIILTPRTVRIADGGLHLDGLTARDPELLFLVSNAKDPEAAVLHALTVGARLLNLTAVDKVI